MNTTFVFVINPLSGNGKNKFLVNVIEKFIEKHHLKAEIKLTTHAGHLTKLAEEAVRSNKDVLVVVGGDGTVHEAVQALVGSKTSLAIIPTGSGNGFANHFLIPHAIEDALSTLLKKRSIKTDTLLVNSVSCAATCGVGFDAHIAHLFASYGARGFNTYIRLVMKEYFRFKEFAFTLEADEKKISGKAFLLTFANTSQFGNNAVIAPQAIANDGLLNVCIIKKISLWKAPLFAYKLFNKTINTSDHYDTFSCKNLKVHFPILEEVHIDGEPIAPIRELNISVVPQSLELIIP